MSGDRRKFHFLKKIKSGHFIFEWGEPARVLGSGKAKTGEKRTNVEDVWLIEVIKHSILTVSQMVDGGKEVVFNSKGCFIQKEGSKTVIARGGKTPYNVYVLKGRVRK